MTSEPEALDFNDAIARAAFRLLLDVAEPHSAASVAQRAGANERQVVAAFADLLNAGRAEFADDGLLLGVYGLTLKPTQHRVTLRGHTYFVWCAFDAVGIPAALGESAEILSECAHCGRELGFCVESGKEPESSPMVISWRARECESIREEFCPAINFYCDGAHYSASVPGNPSDGAFLTMEAAAALGRRNWGWAATSPGRRGS